MSANKLAIVIYTFLGVSTLGVLLFLVLALLSVASTQFISVAVLYQALSFAYERIPVFYFINF